MVECKAAGEMDENITVYQKPTCSKCRTTVGILRDHGVAFESVNYYETPLTAPLIRDLLQKLGMKPRELLRKDEQVYRDLDLARRELFDDELIDLMAAYPDLVQRPIVVRGDRAVLGRPPENVEDLF